MSSTSSLIVAIPIMAAFFYRKEKLSDMFDVDDVVDALRPPLKK